MAILRLSKRDDFGHPIAYDSAADAGCVVPSAGKIFYAPFASSKNAAETGQAFDVTGSLLYEKKSGVPCVTFNGDNYITFPDAGFPEGDNPRTLSCWINCNDLSYWNNPCVFSYGDRSTAHFCGIFVATNSGITFAGYGGANNLSTDGGLIATDKWYHIAVTKDGAEENIYINGVLKASGETGKDTWLDCGQIADTTDSDKYRYDGSLAACRVYNRALSPDEIALLAKEFSA